MTTLGNHFTFKLLSNYPNQPEHLIIMTTDAVCMADITETFENFLKGCGFFPPEGHHLDWVEDE
jgi:hypothetical protein|tara:strand:- start:3402 stop:3593 length:192 start_codon:yes stop_codon:yes gene_type:complete